MVNPTLVSAQVDQDWLHHHLILHIMPAPKLPRFESPFCTYEDTTNRSQHSPSEPWHGQRTIFKSTFLNQLSKQPLRTAQDYSTWKKSICLLACLGENLLHKVLYLFIFLSCTRPSEHLECRAGRVKLKRALWTLCLIWVQKDLHIYYEIKMR